MKTLNQFKRIMKELMGAETQSILDAWNDGEFTESEAREQLTLEGIISIGEYELQQAYTNGHLEDLDGRMIEAKHIKFLTNEVINQIINEIAQELHTEYMEELGGEIEMEDMTYAQLVEVAKEKQIKGYYKYTKKADLLQFIQSQVEVEPETTEPETTELTTIQDLAYDYKFKLTKARRILRDHGFTKTSGRWEWTDKETIKNIKLVFNEYIKQ